MPQQQKTDKFEIPDLPDLNENQFNFVKAVLAGKSASEAYRQAYDCAQMADNVVWASASRLRHHADVALWIKAGQVAKLGTAKVTLDGHVLELEALREIAKETGNIGAAVNAETNRGKAAGLYIERVENIQGDTQATLGEIVQAMTALPSDVKAEIVRALSPPAIEHERRDAERQDH